MTTPTNPDSELDEILDDFLAGWSDGSDDTENYRKIAKAKLQQWSAKRENAYIDNFNLVARSKIPAEWTEPITGKKLYNEAAVVKRELEARNVALNDAKAAIDLENIPDPHGRKAWYAVDKLIPKHYAGATFNKELETP